MSEIQPSPSAHPGLHAERPEGAQPRIWSCLVIIGLMLVAGFFGARYMTSGNSKGDDKKKEKKPIPVTIANVTTKDVPVELHIVGSVTPFSTVPVISQVTGVLVKFHIKQGDFVYQGQPLVSIDARPQKAALDQAEANVSKDQANVSQAGATLSRDLALINQAEANLSKDMALVRQAKSNLAKDLGQLPYTRREAKRYKQLLAEGFVTAEQTEQELTNVSTLGGTLDADRAAVRAAESTVAADQAAVASARATALADGATIRSLQATVHADQAAAENANVQLKYTEINSPINGRTGTQNVYEGALVQAGSATPLITIDQIQPIRVSFAVPEKYLTEIRERQRLKPLEVFAVAPDSKGRQESGSVSFIENTVDATTGTIMLRADFPNRDRSLWPGQFVNVNLLLRHVTNALTIPSQSVQPGTNGDYVFVVKDDKTVDVRHVVIDFTFGDLSIVKSGLKAGETVVTDGQLQLVPGSAVDTSGRKAGPSATPSASGSPTAAGDSSSTPAEGGHKRHRRAGTEETATPGPQ